MDPVSKPQQARSLIERVIDVCVEYRLIVLLVTALTIFWGIRVAPFDWNIPGVSRDPIPVDAIPDIGEKNSHFPFFKINSSTLFIKYK